MTTRGRVAGSILSQIADGLQLGREARINLVDCSDAGVERALEHLHPLPPTRPHTVHLFRDGVELIGILDEVVELEGLFLRLLDQLVVMVAKCELILTSIGPAPLCKVQLPSLPDQGGSPLSRQGLEL